MSPLRYKADNINDLELLYSILRKEYPDNQIDATFHKSSLQYFLQVTKKPFREDPEVPVHLDVKVVYGDTDSVFLKFKYNRNDFNKNRGDTFRLATLCGNKLTDEVFKRPPIEMEFEKVFQPFVLLTKKRYIAKKFENTKDPFQLKGIDAKGIALTRRDYCKMVKNCYKEVIDAIMDDNFTGSDGLDHSVHVFKTYVKKIHKHQIPIDDLVVSAMLAKEYKTDSQPHVILKNKLKERKEEVQVGDRIPYIFVENDDPKAKKSQMAEDPKYAVQNNIKFNRLCYLEQLAKPLLGFFKIVLKEKPDLLDEVIDYVNDDIVAYGGKRLKPSDFKDE
jgi:DNA polymerase delta subunit 1